MRGQRTCSSQNLISQHVESAPRPIPHDVEVTQNRFTHNNFAKGARVHDLIDNEKNEKRVLQFSSHYVYNDDLVSNKCKDKNEYSRKAGRQ